VGAVAARQAWKAGRVSSRSSAEERLLRCVESSEDIRHDMAMDGGIVGKLLANRLHLRFLLLATHGDMAPLPGRAAVR
jgi:hypothetical protein